MIDCIRPISIALPEKTMLANGTMFMNIQTLGEFMVVANDIISSFKYATRGSNRIDPTFLNEFDWVFGNTKAAVAETVYRIGKSTIDCEFVTERFRWELCKLPSGFYQRYWLNDARYEDGALSNPQLSKSLAMDLLCEKSWEDWVESDTEEVRSFHRSQLVEKLGKWQACKEIGLGYYGVENEVRTLINSIARKQ